MTKDKALRMALEALEIEQAALAYEHGKVEHIENAITAIKEALSSPNGEAQPAVTESHKQEPVAWPVEEQPDGSVIPIDPSEMTAEQLQRYITPPQRKPLTDEQMQFLATAIGQAQQIIDTHNAEFVTARDHLRRCAELLAAHGIKENT